MRKETCARIGDYIEFARICPVRIDYYAKNYQVVDVFKCVWQLADICNDYDKEILKIFKPLPDLPRKVLMAINRAHNAYRGLRKQDNVLRKAFLVRIMQGDTYYDKTHKEA